jgi:predicted CXXCH cytochrome family protein
MKKNCTDKLLPGLILFFGLLVACPAGVMAMATEDCLMCHAEADMVGEKLSIDASAFTRTDHALLGCLTCHDSVTDGHPGDGQAVSRSTCLDCHEEVGRRYQQTAHVQYAGCVDCHDPHRARGLEAVSSYDMNQQCTQCHENATVVEQHAEWLPQVELHIAKLPCITCHTSSEGYEIVLNITQKPENKVPRSYVMSSYADLKAYSGEKKINTLLDVNQNDFISLAELRTFNLNPAYEGLRLQGTLVPLTASHDLSTLDSRYDCSFCHASGPESMQTSFLALPNPDGSFVRLDVEKGAVLHALYGTPDFYMMGSSRSASLNIIGFIIICCGLIMPIGHGTLRFLTRKNRRH